MIEYVDSLAVLYLSQHRKPSQAGRTSRWNAEGSDGSGTGHDRLEFELQDIVAASAVEQKAHGWTTELIDSFGSMVLLDIGGIGRCWMTFGSGCCGGLEPWLQRADLPKAKKVDTKLEIIPSLHTTAFIYSITPT